jgi:hypothetical protein
MAEPIQPEAPVTKMRMEILLGRALGDDDARQTPRPENRCDPVASTLTPPYDSVASLAQVMRSGRFA